MSEYSFSAVLTVQASSKAKAADEILEDMAASGIACSLHDEGLTDKLLARAEKAEMKLEKVEALIDEWTQPLVEDQGLEEEMYENVARSMANACAAELRVALK